MAKKVKVSESLTNAEVSEILTVENVKTENMENETIAPVSETLTESQESVNGAQPETLTLQQQIDDLSAKIKDAKKALNALNEQFDYDEQNKEIISAENELSKLTDTRKDLNKQLDKENLIKLQTETLENAKADLISKLGIDLAKLQELLTNAKNVELKDTLVQSFNIVFGKSPVVALPNETGKHLAKRVANTSNANGFNITKEVKAMLTAGSDAETIVSTLLANTDMDETKAKKRLNDVRWAWEIENGLREKPAK